MWNLTRKKKNDRQTTINNAKHESDIKNVDDDKTKKGSTDNKTKNIGEKKDNNSKVEIKKSKY